MVKINKKTAPSFVLLLIVSFATFASDATAFAVDTQFYSGNNILYYDKDASCGVAPGTGTVPTATTSQSEDKNAEIVFKFLISTTFTGLGGKPFSALQAAGAVGNFARESTLDPAAIESNGNGHGLAQWSFGRTTTLYALAAKNNKPWSDMGVQLLMIENEINGSYGPSLLNAGFGSVTTPPQAAQIFEQVYESAGVIAEPDRDAAASKYYDMFKGTAPGTVDVVTGGCNSATATSFTANGFVIYDQCDPKWGSLPYGTTGKTECTSGCGPTAMAMAITALTGRAVTPDQTIDYASSQGMYVAGEGSSWLVPKVLGDHFGITATAMPSATIAAVNTVLQAGGLVILAGMNSAPFTYAGHYILIRGLTADGQWMIADSNGSVGQSNSTKPWDPQHIIDYSVLNGIGSMYALTK